MKDSLSLKKEQTKKSSKKESPAKSKVTIFGFHIQRNKLNYFVGFLLTLNIIVFLVLLYFIQAVRNNLLPPQRNSVISTGYLPQSEDDNLETLAAAFVVYDVESRSVVSSKNKDLRLSPASTAKIVTAILALEYFDTEELLVVPDLSSVKGSKMGLIAGEEIKVINLLYGMMLPSGNDAAYVISYYYPGGLSGLVNAMNQKTVELRLSNTQFIDPSGYEDTNFSTAIELARIAAYAMQNPIFREIVGTRSRVVYDRTFTFVHPLRNINELLRNPKIVGIKTGFTNEAGGVLVSAIEDKGRLFIVVVLKSDDRFLDTRLIIDEVVNNISYSTP